MTKNVFEADGLLFTSDKRTIETSLLFSDLFYQIPGGLTREQFDENPRQARQEVPIRILPSIIR